MNYKQNIELALRNWADVPKMKVNLGHWSCGTTHCFGGWLPHFPEFAAMGVVHETYYGSGWPQMYVDGHLYLGGELASYLFGDSNLFGDRDYADRDNGISDWQLVQDRLVHALENLTTKE